MLVRPFRRGDVPEILVAYKEAFEGFPWNQKLEEELVASIWDEHSRKSGFVCLVGTVNESVVAMAWWDTPGSDDLRQERGEDLAAFALRLGAPPRTIVWEREVLVRPIYHGRGYGKEIRIRAHDVIRATFPKALVLTRMREDNAPILAIGTKMGFARTGIRMPSRNPKTFHEYWYRDLATS